MLDEMDSDGSYRYDEGNSQVNFGGGSRLDQSASRLSAQKS